MGSESATVENDSVVTDYRSEKSRLETFETWPASAPIPANRLAKAGFLYDGNNLSVECFACKVRISDWDFGDVAIQKHRTHSSNCPFLVELENSDLTTDFGASNDVTMAPPSSHPQAALKPGRIDLGASGGCSSQVGAKRFNEKTWESFDSLRYESERRKTFALWPLLFISPEDLAKDGFFYLREDDKVQCVFCQGIIGEWEENDVPHEEHKRYFPSCGFILNIPVGNIPLSSAGIDGVVTTVTAKRTGRDICGRYKSTNDWWSRDSVPERSSKPRPSQSQPNRQLEELGITRHQGPKYKDYATEESRRRTFDNWPPGLAQKPDALAEAGFYYCGISDHVRCFHCGGGLRNWEPDDKPWVEHARWIPQCAFIRLVKGEDFVNDVRAQHPVYSSQSSSSSTETTPPISPEEEKRPPPFSLRPVSDAEVQSLMEVEPAKTVLGLGVDRGLVRRAILSKMRQTGIPFTTPEALIEAAFSDEESMTEEREVDQIAESSSSPFTGVEERNYSEMRSNMSIESPSHEVASSLSDMQIQSEMAVTRKEEVIEDDDKRVESMDTDTEEVEAPVVLKNDDEGTLEEQNRKLKEALKEQRLCKICLDNDVGVVFLPCGHLLSCVQCAPALKDCPMCRKVIKGTVRTFMS